MRWSSLFSDEMRCVSWERWFAWRPVHDEITRSWYWLEYVWRNRFGKADWAYLPGESEGLKGDSE
jgi:hypothetical protein